MGVTVPGGTFVTSSTTPARLGHGRLGYPGARRCSTARCGFLPGATTITSTPLQSPAGAECRGLHHPRAPPRGVYHGARRPGIHVRAVTGRPKGVQESTRHTDLPKGPADIVAPGPRESKPQGGMNYRFGGAARWSRKLLDPPKRNEPQSERST